MDLGLGSSNQRVGDLTKRALLQQTAAQETALQNELDQYDDLLNDEEAIAKLRSQRLQELKKNSSEQAEFRAAGHGVYSELVASQQDTRDVARAFFDTAKASERVVVHFYRPSTAHYCDVFHKHLERLAEQHFETRFVKLNVEDCDATAPGKGASFLVDRLGVIVMPTLVLIHKRQAVHHVRGFDELGNTDDFSTATLARLLARHKVLRLKPDEEDDESDDNQEDGYRYRSSGGGVNRIRISRERSRFKNREEEEEEY